MSKEGKTETLNVLLRIKKQHKLLKKFTSDDKNRTIMHLVCVDADKGHIVASNGFVMAAMKIDIHTNRGSGVVTLPNSMVDKESVLEVTGYNDYSYHCTGKSVNECAGTTGKYPNWSSVIPNLSEEQHFRLTKDGVATMMNFLKEVKKQPNNAYLNNKKVHKLAIYYKSYERVVHLHYEEPDNGIDMKCDVGLEGYSTQYMQMGISVENLLKIDKVWNGSFWFIDPSRSVVFDDDAEDTFLIMPMMLDKDYVTCDTEYINFNIYGMDRYNNNSAFASTIPSKPKKEPAPKQKPAPKPAPPTGNLYVVNHETETETKTKTEVPKQEVQKQEVPKQEVPDSGEPAMKIERTTAMAGRRFYPLLILSQGDTQVIVAGNSLYEAICDEEGDIRPMYQELFDSTDAFIDDDLLTADTLDEAAICEAVTQFMDMVENAS